MANVPLHVVQRGINRNACFFSTLDYDTYLHYLGICAERFGCAVHAYCLMTNHVHLLITPPDAETCARFMKHLSQCYVQTLNNRFARTGTLWGGRFRSSPVLSESHVFACYRYIELNPVRAGIVDSPAQYCWSSHSANVDPRPHPLLTQHAVYQALGLDSFERATAYANACREPLPPLLLEEIRKAIRTGSVIGAMRRGKGRPSTSNEKNGVCPHL